MSKNIKLSFIYSFALACVIIAFKSISSIVGLGVAFVAVLVLFSCSLILVCIDKLSKTRTFDLFIISAIFTAVEFLIFFVVEINSNIVTADAIKGFGVFQNVVSVFALVYFFYIVFRIITELKGNRISFVEKLLNRNQKPKEPKKAKELTNGSLMEKPNKNKESELRETKDKKETETKLSTENDKNAQSDKVQNDAKPFVSNTAGTNNFNYNANKTNSISQTEVVVKSNFNDEHIEN